MSAPPYFECPQCGARSYNPNDIQFGYCGNCHEFTGGADYGHVGHSSRSTQQRSKGGMLMQPNDENANAEQQMPEVPRNGDRDSLRDVQRERMELGQQHNLPDLPGQRFRVTQDGSIQWTNLGGTSGATEPWMLRPSALRFYIGAVAMGMAVGISWTLLLVDSALIQRHISHRHALEILYGFVAVAFVMQTIYLVIESRRLNYQMAKLKEFYATADQQVKEFCVEHGIDPK